MDQPASEMTEIHNDRMPSMQQSQSSSAQASKPKPHRPSQSPRSTISAQTAPISVVVPSSCDNDLDAANADQPAYSQMRRTSQVDPNGRITPTVIKLMIACVVGVVLMALAIGVANLVLISADNDKAEHEMEIPAVKDIQSLSPLDATDVPALQSNNPTMQSVTPSGSSDIPTSNTGGPTFRTDHPSQSTGGPSEATDHPSQSTDGPSRSSDSPTMRSVSPTDRPQTEFPSNSPNSETPSNSPTDIVPIKEWLISDWNDKCLELQGKQVDTQRATLMADCSSRQFIEQEWSYDRRTKQIQPWLASSFCLTAASNGQVGAVACGAYSGQQWEFERDGRVVQIRNLRYNQCLNNNNGNAYVTLEWCGANLRTLGWKY